jgi:zinc protease
MKKSGLKVYLLGLAGLFSLSVVSAAGLDIEIPVEKYVLDNGLTVLIHEDHKTPIVAVGVWYHVGSKDEPEGKTGFAHLFEHLMFEGSENYKSGLSSPLKLAGASSLNGTTTLDRTNYFENVPTPALELALWLESDRMGHLLGAISQEKLDQERAAVQNEKRQSDTQPYGGMHYLALKGLFPPGHPYRHSTMGSMDDLEAASLEDVQQWFTGYYGAANAVLVLAGDIDTERGRELAQKYFGDIPAGPPVSRLKSWVPARRDDKYEVMYDHVPHIRSYRMWAVPGWTKKDRLLLQLAAAVLGDGINSRLHQALVNELQYAVDVVVNVQPFELASLFAIDTTLTPGTSVDQVNAIIEQELQAFLRDGSGEDELSRAKAKINAGVIRSLERIGGFQGKATTLVQGELYDGDPAFFKTALSWINHATTSEMREAAQRWLSGGLYQLDVFPYGDHRVSASNLDRSTGPPTVTDLPDIRFPEVQRARLSNGLNVVLAERTAIPVVSLSLQFDAGFAADAGLKPGTAGFTLALIGESTRSRSALDIADMTASLGAEIFTASNLDTSKVSLSALSENLAPSIEIFADVIRNPAFTVDEIERSRMRLLASIEQEKNQPLSIALRTLPPLIYGDGHAYGIPFTGSGSEKSINEISQDDLAEFHSNWIRPDNATLFVVGATTLNEIMPMLESGFGNWKAPASALPRKNIGEVSLPGQTRVIIIDKPDSQQSLILAAHLAPPTGVENNIDILMMNDIIGGQYSSRVSHNLRFEKNWTYGAFTVLRDARGQRPWMIYAPVQPEHTADSVRELLGEFDRFLDTEPATAEELTRVYRNSAFSLPGQYETSAAVLETLQANEQFGRSDGYVASLKTQYQAVSLTNIQSAARQVLHPDRITWVIVGDRSKIEDSLRELGIAEVEFMNTDGQFIE